jgi:hypothetical protein
MKYRVENIKSGAVFGVYEADSPEEAIKAMYVDAGYSDGEPPEYDDGSAGWGDNIRAYEVSTVQMVDAVRAAEGYIEYRGDGEDADEWLDSLSGYWITDAGAASGWGEYTHLVRLDDLAEEYSHSPVLFYLIPDVIYARIDWDQDLEARTREIESMDI